MNNRNILITLMENEKKSWYQTQMEEVKSIGKKLLNYDDAAYADVLEKMRVNLNTMDLTL